MADDDDDLNGNDEGGTQGAPKPGTSKDLRAKLEDALARLKERDEQLEKYAKQDRASKIATFLKSAEANEGLAEFVAIDGDVTEDKVKAWLDAKGAIFGYQKPEPLTEDQQLLQRQAAQIAAATNAALPPTPGLTVDRLKTMTHAELIQAGYINAD